MFGRNIYIILSCFIFEEPFWLKQTQKKAEQKKKHATSQTQILHGAKCRP